MGFKDQQHYDSRSEIKFNVVSSFNYIGYWLICVAPCITMVYVWDPGPASFAPTPSGLRNMETRGRHVMPSVHCMPHHHAHTPRLTHTPLQMSACIQFPLPASTCPLPPPHSILALLSHLPWTPITLTTYNSTQSHHQPYRKHFLPISDKEEGAVSSCSCSDGSLP